MMEPRDPTIGERVMLIRRRRGLTQQELATTARMSKTALNRLENGLQSVYAERLATLARLLNVSADYLLGLQEAQHAPRDATAPEDRHNAPVPARTTTRHQRTRTAASVP
jgi:transcriptional regulator with XRE-family HTH domain